MATKHISMTAVGFDKVRKQFNLLPIKVQDRVMKSATRAASNEFKKGMEFMAPRDLGHLASNMQVKIKQYKRGLITTGIIGAAYKWIPVPKSVRWTKTGTVNPALVMNVTNKGIHAGKNVGWVQGVYNLARSEAQKRFETFFVRGLRREGKKLGMK